MTIRQAIGELVQEGVLTRKRVEELSYVNKK